MTTCMEFADWSVLNERKLLSSRSCVWTKSGLDGQTADARAVGTGAVGSRGFHRTLAVPCVPPLVYHSVYFPMKNEVWQV